MLIETLNKIQAAADQLDKTERGQHALRKLSDWLHDNHMLMLDSTEQAALMTLLSRAWQYPTTTRGVVTGTKGVTG